MKSPEVIATDIVNQFVWTSNVHHKGMLVSQQVVVAEVIADAIEADRTEAAAEIARLQDAKRRALAVADERSKENVALRAENERLRDLLVEGPDRDTLIERRLNATRELGK